MFYLIELLIRLIMEETCLTLSIGVVSDPKKGILTEKRRILKRKELMQKNVNTLHKKVSLKLTNTRINLFIKENLFNKI